MITPFLKMISVLIIDFLRLLKLFIVFKPEAKIFNVSNYKVVMVNQLFVERHCLKPKSRRKTFALMFEKVMSRRWSLLGVFHYVPFFAFHKKKDVVTATGFEPTTT